LGEIQQDVNLNQQARLILAVLRGVVIQLMLEDNLAEMEAAKYTGPAKAALKDWEKPALVMFSDKDPVTGGGDIGFRKLIPSAKNEPEITIEGGGHFLQEDCGEVIAENIVAFINRHAN